MNFTGKISHYIVDFFVFKQNFDNLAGEKKHVIADLFFVMNN